MTIGIDEQIACAKRELGLRQRVYPAFVDRKKITADKATYEIEAMKAVLKTLETVKALGSIAATPAPFVAPPQRVPAEDG